MAHIKNIALGLISTLISLVLLELCVILVSPSILTPMQHDFLRMANHPGIQGIDDKGFRNSNDIGHYDISAVGDSFTYGYNVYSDNTWPKLLSSQIESPIYNYGVGGFNYLDYYQATELAFRSSSSVIVAIYLGNDLTQGVCLTFRLPYWQSRAKLLDLEYICDSRDVDEESRVTSIIGGSKLVSLVKYSLGHALPQLISRFSGSLLSREQLIDFSTDEKFLRHAARATNLELPFVAHSYAAAVTLMTELKVLAENDGKRLAFMLIPSQSRVVMQLGELEIDHSEIMAVGAANEAVLIEAFKTRLADDCVPVIDATPWLVDALDRSLDKGEFFWAPGADDHLMQPGYDALAAAAKTAFEGWNAPNSICGRAYAQR